MMLCQICNVQVSSGTTMKEHIKGKHHRRMLNRGGPRSRTGQTSLYCCGFPAVTLCADLTSYFTQFGPVQRVHMADKSMNRYGIVHFNLSESAQRALSVRRHWFPGCQLIVRPHRPITKQRKSPGLRDAPKMDTDNDQEDNSSYEMLFQRMLELDDVGQQMEMLHSEMRLSAEDRERREEVCCYLHRILLPYFPTCTVHPFGSTVNGLGLSGCDMDLFVDFHEAATSLQREKHLRQRLCPVSLPFVRDLRALDVTEGPLLPSQLKRLPMVLRVKLLSRVLKMTGTELINIVFIPSSRCPIVRLTHGHSGIQCDISINNRLGLCNTQLISMYVEDWRVRLLVMTARLWGKLKGVSSGSRRLSNYSLSLLVMFYLMNTSPPILFPPSKLEALAGANEKDVLDGWECSLPSRVVSPVGNTQYAEDLLRGFFQFFAGLSLDSSVISTRTGTVVPLKNFLLKKLSCPRLDNFKEKCLAVQDPFVLSHNITQNVGHMMLKHLENSLSNAAAKNLVMMNDTYKPHTKSILAAYDPPGFFTACRLVVPRIGCLSLTWTSHGSISEAKKSNSPWGLPYLFSSDADQKPSVPAPFTAQSSAAAPSDPGILPPVMDRWSFQVKCGTSQFGKSFVGHRGVVDVQACVFQRVRQWLLWTLQDVLLFTVEDRHDLEAAVTEDGALPDGKEGVSGRDGHGCEVSGEQLPVDVSGECSLPSPSRKSGRRKNQSWERVLDQLKRNSRFVRHGVHGLVAASLKSKTSKKSVTEGGLLSAVDDHGRYGAYRPSSGDDDEMETMGGVCSAPQHVAGDVCATTDKGDVALFSHCFEPTSASPMDTTASSLSSSLWAVRTSTAFGLSAGAGVQDEGSTVLVADHVTEPFLLNNGEICPDQNTSLEQSDCQRLDGDELLFQEHSANRTQTVIVTQQTRSTENSHHDTHTGSSTVREKSTTSVRPASDISLGPASDISVGPASDISVGPASDIPVSPVSDVPASPVSDVPVSPVSDIPASPVSDIRHVHPIQHTAVTNVDFNVPAVSSPPSILGESPTRQPVTAPTTVNALTCQAHLDVADKSAEDRSMDVSPPSWTTATSSRRMLLYCHGNHRAWQGRKAVKARLLAEGMLDQVTVEKMVSEVIAGGTKLNSAKIFFYCRAVVSVVDGTEPHVTISLRPDMKPAPKYFDVFFAFFKSFFSKFVGKNLGRLPCDT